MSNKTVLIVDDVSTNIQMMAALVKTCGHDYEGALDGETALAYMLHNVPDLVILDIYMPKMSGYEVCEIMRSNARLTDVPIMFITAGNDDGDPRLELADAVLFKPVKSQVIISTMRELLGDTEPASP